MQEIVDYIKNHNNYIITSHAAPDGDNIGSSIAMTEFLKNVGKNAYHFIDDAIPDNLNFITKRVNIYNSEQFEGVMKNDEYTIIILDCGNKGRVNISNEIIDNADYSICIDHHEKSENFCNLNFVYEKASSTCELVYDFAKQYDENKIDELVATALYTGLATDTGHFKYDCTQTSSFYMAADLMKKGCQKQEVIKSIYQSDEYNYKRLEADLIVNYTEKIDDICIMTMSNEILNKYQVKLKDTENIVNNTVNIKGVEVGVLLKEKENGIVKVSLRSKERVNVADIAGQFKGGGHERAAGLTLENTSLKDAKIIILEKLKEFI